MATNDRLVDGQAIPPAPKRTQDLMNAESAKWKGIDPPKPKKRTVMQKANYALEKLLRW